MTRPVLLSRRLRDAQPLWARSVGMRTALSAAVEMWQQQGPWLDVPANGDRPIALQIAEQAAAQIEGGIVWASHGPTRSACSVWCRSGPRSWLKR